MFAIKPNRKFTFKYGEGTEDAFTVDFDFICIEQINSDEVKNILKNVNGVIYYFMRKSLISVSGLINVDSGEPLKLYNEDGSINEEIQKAVFEFVMTFEEFRDQLITAYAGVSSKNLKTGVTPQ